MLGAAAGVTALGALIAYLASSGSNKACEEKTSHRDRSEGKKVGKQVNLLQRKVTKVISEEPEEEEEEPVNIQEMLALELKRHKSE